MHTSQSCKQQHSSHNDPNDRPASDSTTLPTATCKTIVHAHHKTHGILSVGARFIAPALPAQYTHQRFLPIGTGGYCCHNSLVYMGRGHRRRKTGEDPRRLLHETLLPGAVGASLNML